MKVVLLADVKGTGKKDDIVEISDGYARNFLFPRKLAVQATSSAINIIEGKNSAKEHRAAEELAAAKETAAKVDGSTVVIHAKSGTGDRLFGSITSKEIAEAIAEKTGCEVDKRKVVLDKDIKSHGKYEVVVKIFPGVTAKVTVDVCE